MLLTNLLSWLPGHSGFGSYVQRVLPAIEGYRLQLGDMGQCEILPAHKWTVKPPSWSPNWQMRLLQRYNLVQHGLNFNDVFRHNNLNINQVEVIYSPFFDALLAINDVPQLITCHDLTPLVESNSRKAWFRYRYWQPRHCNAASRLIAISSYVADQLMQFGVDSRSIEVIPNGINIERPPVNSPRSENFLVLARHDINKNLPFLLKGIAQLQMLCPHWKGVFRIVGKKGRQTSLVQNLHRQLPNPDQVLFSDTMSQEELIATLRSSMALISASTEEGFDYPILEAKAEGVPTVISNIRVHREFHNDSSLFFSLSDNGLDFSHQVSKLLSDFSLWSQLSREGISLAQSLSLKNQQIAINAQIRDLVS